MFYSLSSFLYSCQRKRRVSDQHTIYKHLLHRGPRGARIVGLLDTDDLERSDVLKCCDVVVATPELAADLYERDVEFFDDLKVAWLHPFPTSQN